jgi:hypothetical protein
MLRPHFVTHDVPPFVTVYSCSLYFFIQGLPDYSFGQFPVTSIYWSSRDGWNRGPFRSALLRSNAECTPCGTALSCSNATCDIIKNNGTVPTVYPFSRIKVWVKRVCAAGYCVKKKCEIRPRLPDSFRLINSAASPLTYASGLRTLALNCISSGSCPALSLHC